MTGDSTGREARNVRRRWTIAAAALLLGGTVSLAACGGDSDGGDAAGTTSTSEAGDTSPGDSTTTAAAETTTAAPSTTLAGASPGPGCTDGWKAPAVGSDDYIHALDAIRGQMGIEGEFEVVEMRKFTGPEVPWIIEPRPDHVDWWYVKARMVDDPAFAGRWLVVRRSEVRQGIDAVAPFDSTGFASPDWHAFEGDGPPNAIEGLPGMWGGIDYDFVTGDGGETPGLPDEVTGCLAGT